MPSQTIIAFSGQDALVRQWDDTREYSILVPLILANWRRNYRRLNPGLDEHMEEIYWFIVYDLVDNEIFHIYKDFLTPEVRRNYCSERYVFLFGSPF